ncbi:MAG: protein kinase [Pirellula sp.]
MNQRIVKDLIGSSCDDTLLNALLDGSLSAMEMGRLESHLSECSRCAEWLQATAVTEASWESAKSMLAPDEYDAPNLWSACTQALDEADSSEVHMSRTQTADVLTREIRGWLDPTDDPHSLGRFAGYEIVGIVGHGGMGIVLKGFEASLNRFVAIKVLAPRLATNGSARHRFAREAQAAAAVRHENVIAIHRVDDWHGLPFLVMPYVGGLSLQRRLETEGSMTIEQTLRVGLQISSGLAAAHAQGLVHRDIKPANILLEQGVERVTITDFGLARAVDDASVTRTGIIAGTPQYMSPEQAEAKPLDARSDLFSLGSVLYTMATGRPPFRGDGSFDILRRITQETASRMQDFEPTIPNWFQLLVNRLHAKHPEDRPASASELTNLLQACLSHLRNPATTDLPDSLINNSPSPQRRRYPPMFAWLVTAAIAFLAFWAGIIIVIETNKGTLKIECEADDVPIRILQGDKVVEKLSVTKAGNTVRVASGNYTVEIDGTFDKLEIRDGHVDLKRGDTAIVKVVHSSDAATRTSQNGDAVQTRLRGGGGSQTVVIPSNEPISSELTGDVEISFVPEMGLNIIKGKKEDVQRVNDLIERMRTQNRLRDAIDAFNQFIQKHDPTSKEPPLSREEVLAFAGWNYQTEKNLSPTVKACLYEISQRNLLPAGWKFRGGTTKTANDDQTQEFYRIELVDESEKYRITVRQRCIKSSPGPAIESLDQQGGTPLASAIRSFNIRYREADGIAQPPLTEDEVVAAILHWRTKRDEAEVDDSLFERFQAIARTRYLPAGTEFELIPRFGMETGESYTIWSIRIKMPQTEENKRGWTYAFILREQFISVKHGKANTIHWGTPGANGLQAGVRLSPSSTAYELGQEIEVEFFFRNILGQPLRGSLPNAMSYNSIDVTDQDGQHVEVRNNRAEKLIAGAQVIDFNEVPISRKSQAILIASKQVPEKLREGRIAIISEPSQKVAVRFTVSNYADTNIDDLKTGVVEFEVKNSVD